MTRIIPLMTYAHYKNRFERDVSVCASFQLYFNFFTYYSLYLIYSIEVVVT